MPFPRGDAHPKAQKRDARLAEYIRLRQSGMEPGVAGYELGLSDSTQKRYERGYRSQAGPPAPPARPRRPDFWWS